MTIELATLTTQDGVELDGAMYRPEPQQPRGGVNIVMVHGLTWNFYRGPSRWLPPLLAEAGFPCLSLNMRDHDLKEPKDFPLAHHDLRAGIDHLEGEGGEVVVLAHGFACNKLVCYAATSGDDRPRRQILTTFGAVKAYRPELWATVMASAPKMRGATLVVQGAVDPEIEPRARADELVAAATGSRIEVELLAGGDHYFNKRHAELAQAITAAGSASHRSERREMGLNGKAALVTGGSGAIGAAIAEALAQRGASVTLAYFRNEAAARDVAGRITAAGGTAFAAPADIRRRSEVKRLFAAHLDRFGRLDILVNNAGDMVRRVPTAETSEETWRAAIDLNLSSAFFCCQEAIAPMAAQGWGRIVNISSVGARTGGGAGSIPYHAAKAGLMALTKGLAKEVAASGITVNTVAPGIIETPFHDRHTAPEVKAGWVETLIPMQRAGLPSEVADAVAFVASDAAAYMTGATLDINGGMAMY